MAHKTKALVQKWIARVGVREANGSDEIRRSVLDEFTKQLDAKLANLQTDEMIAAQFRIEIIGRNGAIRSGSGAARNMPEYRSWRATVYERDAYTCQECGQVGGSLEAHHIKPWSECPELRFDVDNGITLCKPCHAKKHPHLRLVNRGAA